MKVHKSIMNRNQIELSGFENVNQVNAMVWSLNNHDGVAGTVAKLNMTVIVTCKPGRRNEIYKLVTS